MNGNVDPVVRGFDYSAFIDELRPLVEEARAFDNSQRRFDSDDFRAWRHKVADLTTKISRTHMDSDSNVEHRQFRVMSAYSSVSSKEQLQAFDRDLRDTLIELDHIIEQFTKYGEPQLRTGARRKLQEVQPVVQAAAIVEPAKPIEAQWPSKEKLTLHWVLKNMPLSAWGWLAVFVGGAFTVGVTVGSWPAVQKKLDQWGEPARAAAPAASVASRP